MREHIERPGAKAAYPQHDSLTAVLRYENERPVLRRIAIDDH